MSHLSSEALLAAKRRLLDEDEYGTGSKHKRSNNDTKDKKHKKKKKKEKKSKKKKKSRSSSESSSSSEGSDAWVELSANKKSEDESEVKHSEVEAPKKEPLKRDDWMSITGMFATFTRDDIKPKRDNKKKNIDDYNPATSVRELNPFWKDGGTGLPSESKPRESLQDDRYERNKRNEYSYSRYANKSSDFKKPSFGSYNDDGYKAKYERDSHSSRSKNWQKRRDSPERRNHGESSKRRDSSEDRHSSRQRTDSSSPESRQKYSSHTSSYDDSKPGSSKQPEEQKKNESTVEEKSDFLTDQQMNEIGAKIVKAEITGNAKLVAKLTAKLNAAREYKKKHPNAGKEKDAVMLTLTDEKGNMRPLEKSKNAGDPRSKGGKKKISTHAVTGERTRFFEDDDKYSLTQMFEKEKFGNSYDAEKEFVETMSRHKNPNDDLEDIFAERITKTKSDAKMDEQNKRKAIAQHKTTQKSLENCEFCVDSDKMLKHMMVGLGSKAYVALPSRQSLTEGHCYIATVGHVTCSTMADEDVWSEIMIYRRALTNLFNSRDEDVLFFETATHFHKYPHLVINCVPLPRDVGDTAPIYFKKALLECETEWSNNKKVIDLKGKDVRRGVPQRLPYFWVDFGMDPGFAHVIEDQNLFSKNFAQEIVGGILDLDHSLWRKPHRDSFDVQRKKVLEFEKIWKEYDPHPNN